MTNTKLDSHDDGSSQSTSVWPLPKFYFTAQWDDMAMTFQEVSGLDIAAQIIEYRAGNSPVFAAMKMPGLKKYGNVTMKKGIFKSDQKFWDWMNAIKLNTVKRADMVISLLDESGKPTMVWTLANAWPTKITCTDLKSTGNEVAIESIEIVHEGISVANS
jgi:phage tail-like protein